MLPHDGLRRTGAFASRFAPMPEPEGEPEGVHAIFGSDVALHDDSGRAFTLADVQAAVDVLRRAEVPRFEGYYALHVHPSELRAVAKLLGASDLPIALRAFPE